MTAANAGHLPAIAEVYGAAALTPATFDLDPKPLSWWQQVLDEVDPANGRLLLAAFEGDRLLGYAKSGEFREKAAYASTREVSVYLAEDCRGRGVGRILYAELLARLDGVGLRLAVGGVTQPNPASNALHLSLGFTEVGTFSEVGVKLGRAWDVRWYQRRLRP